VFRRIVLVYGRLPTSHIDFARRVDRHLHFRLLKMELLMIFVGGHLGEPVLIVYVEICDKFVLERRDVGTRLSVIICLRRHLPDVDACVSKSGHDHDASEEIGWSRIHYTAIRTRSSSLCVASNYSNY
jgi:hypothetical protein